MPTKLKKPIELKIETHEQAVALWHQLNVGVSNMQNYNYFKALPWLSSLMDSESHPNWKLLHDQLERLGINPKQQPPIPPQPFKIGAHETTFNPNGSIKVGCTDIDRATLEEVLKRSDEAMGAAWPKFYKRAGTTCIYKVESETCAGHYWERGEWNHCWANDPLIDDVKAKPDRWTLLSRAEASAILGRDV